MNAFNHWRLAGVVAALVTAGVLGAALPGMAQKKSAKTDASIGVVDLAQVIDTLAAARIDVGALLGVDS